MDKFNKLKDYIEHLKIEKINNINSCNSENNSYNDQSKSNQIENMPNDKSLNLDIDKLLIDTKFSSLVEDCFSDVNISMCCTGGVRCEKSTAFMKMLGFNNVYHLKGGIINYLDKTKNNNNNWIGECFVFDSRLAVKQNLEPIDDKDCWKQIGKKMYKVDNDINCEHELPNDKIQKLIY